MPEPGRPGGLIKSVATMGALLASAGVLAADDLFSQLRCTPEFSKSSYYQVEAVQQRLTGAVLLEFSINAKGRTQNIAIIESTAPDLLKISAVGVIENFRCKPNEEWMGEGGPQRRLRLNVLFKFKNEEGPKPIDPELETIVISASRSPRK